MSGRRKRWAKWSARRIGLQAFWRRNTSKNIDFEHFTDWEHLRERFRRAGFPPYEENLYDDSGKPVESHCLIRIKNTQDARRAVALAKEEGYGAMAIGSLTSAVGAFQVRSKAKLHGLKGFVGLLVHPGGTLESPAPGDDPDREIYETLVPDIPALKDKVLIFHSKDPSVNHRVRAWAGLTPAEINEALADVLGAGHSVFLDLTTFNQAQIGAVVCNGSQGPVRANARFNLRALTLVDGGGDIRVLQGEDAKNQVGLGGSAGLITEVTLDVIHEGVNEFGFFIPLPGGIGKQYAGMVNHLPRVMAVLDPYARAAFHDDPDGRKLVAARGQVLLKGFEIITRDELRATYGSLREDSEERGRIGSLLETMRDAKCHIGLLVNCTTDVSEDDMIDLLEALFDEPPDSGEESDNLFAAIRGLQKWRDVYRSDDHDDDADEDIVYFLPSEMRALKRMREAIPEMTRASKWKGFTSSTDFNSRVTGDDPAMRERAYKAIMEVYWAYVQDLRDRQFRVYIYGHAHPGMERDAVSGGVDLHIRATYFLEGEDEDTRKRAAEAYVFLQDRKKLFARHLESLHGQFGIHYEPGEKHLSTDYGRWLERHDPLRAETLYRYTQTYGGRTFGATSRLKLHAHPPRLQRGILHAFAPDPSLPPSTPTISRLGKSILLWCQHSHRSPEGLRVLCETQGLLRDWLDLDADERLFFTETSEKAVRTCFKALVNRKKGGMALDLRGKEVHLPEEEIQAVATNDVRLLDNEAWKNVHKILVVQTREPLAAEQRRKAAALVFSGALFGLPEELGLLVCSLKTLEIARKNAGRNRIGYMHSLVEMDERPHETLETPKMQAIAELGCRVALAMGRVPSLSPRESADLLRKQETFFTLNPGPAQINRRIIEHCVSVGQKLTDLAGQPEACREAALAVENLLRKYLNIPKTYSIFFTGSATQAMEQIVESLDVDFGIVGVKGAFGERMLSVARAYGTGRVKSVRLRWGEGENSQIQSIASEMLSKLPAMSLKRSDRSVGFFITGHETSTAVQTDVGALIRAIRERVRKPSKIKRKRTADDPFLFVVDGTSEFGFVRREWREIDVYFGSVQKFMGCPAGLGVLIVSPKAMELARSRDRERSPEDALLAYRTFSMMEEEQFRGHYHNLRGILQLGEALKDYLERGGLRAIQKETERKMRLVQEAVSASPHLAQAVVNDKDRSGVLAHILGVDIEVARLRERLEDHVTLGNGYGPFKNETLRLYLGPNVSESQVKQAMEELQATVREMVAQGERLERPIPCKCRNLDKEWLDLQGHRKRPGNLKEKLTPVDLKRRFRRVKDKLAIKKRRK